MQIKRMIVAMGLLLAPAGFCADEGIFREDTDMKRALYSVDSEELDDTESLNRISGDIDLGFSAEDQSYESTHHYRPGPFGMQSQSDGRYSDR